MAEISPKHRSCPTTPSADVVDIEGVALEPETRRAVAALPGLDGLRGLAAIGVVLLHSCVPYMTPSVPGLAWSVTDTPHWLASQCFWLIELFIMPVFLVMAGYFAWQSLQRSHAKQVVRSRARRLLIPLGFGAIVVLPADLYIWLSGWVADGKIPLRKMKSLKFEDGIDQDLWGLSHLWFLEYLFLYVVVFAVAYSVCKRFPSISDWFRSPRRCFLALFVVASATLVIAPEVVWGFQHRFYPVPSKWLYSGAFFFAGVGLGSFDCGLNLLARHATRYAGFAAAMIFPAMLIGQWHVGGGDQKTATIVLALTTTAAASLTTAALLGFAARFRQPLAQHWNYLAAASFWIYLVHHPFLGLMQIDLKWLLPQVSPVLKVMIGCIGAVSLSLLTYEVWVRKTWLGKLLAFDYRWEQEASTDRLQVSSELPGADNLQIAASEGQILPLPSGGSLPANGTVTVPSESAGRKHAA